VIRGLHRIKNGGHEVHVGRIIVKVREVVRIKTEKAETAFMLLVAKQAQEGEEHGSSPVFLPA